eukprot:CAMPEP_0204150284 /NCGR_PEP_ID=MMETSP0361-20130328/25140_1 /ASSEMBLY_ACC=CAM_ASM_000343 /TAXON_ID=268821 /ORGANISM="Scrippsiella Hangoei, Strain SHTV-5" /LENGTH=87 /DNA_ID=CAMNT_0051104933 /DNA_START=1 /DNA_END=261 /DNA_ORIENTATION=+
MVGGVEPRSRRAFGADADGDAPALELKSAAKTRATAARDRSGDDSGRDAPALELKSAKSCATAARDTAATFDEVDDIALEAARIRVA